MRKATAQYDGRRSNNFPSAPTGSFFTFEAPQAPSIIPGKPYLGAHPYLVPGAAALKPPSRIIQRRPWPISTNTTHFAESSINVGHISPPETEQPVTKIKKFSVKSRKN
jgi:hypothetical protein